MRLAAATVLAAVFVAGCGDSDGSMPGDDASVSPDAELLTINAVRLRQALAGAMWANPSVYPQLPIQVSVYGTAGAVSVDVDGTRVIAEDPDNDNIWTAMVDISSLAEGVAYDVVATGTGLYGTVVTHEATLTLGSNGMRITDVGQHGAAVTPRLHNVNRELWVTWVDARDTERKLWLQRFDGAGVPLPATETPVCLVCSGDPVTARVAAGDASLGVLYQTAGTPLVNWFQLVDGEGNAIIAPIALDPMGWDGASGGDVVFDGEHFLVVWRSDDGLGNSEIRWLRVHGSSGDTVGPIVVAAAGDGNPNGDFAPTAPVKVAFSVDKTFVSFVRDRYDMVLGMSLPRAQVVTLDRNGTILDTEVVGPVSAWAEDDASHVFSFEHGGAVVWSTRDMTASPPIPTGFRGATINAAGTLDPDRGEGADVVTAAGARSDPVVVEHNVHPAVMAWLDGRGGPLALYTAPLSASLNSGAERMFNHPQPSADLSAFRAGTNLVIGWLDMRNGDAEVWLDTAWY